VSADFSELPAGLPVPEDDGAADHLVGLEIPALRLPSTAVASPAAAEEPASLVELARGLLVAYVYPRTGVPGQPLPAGWDDIPGARGCTPQSCGFRDHFAELKGLGVSHLFGLSTQDTDYQREAAERLHLPFAILSDAALSFTRAMRLPTFTVAGMTLLKRMALVLDEGVIANVFYPVFPPDRNAAEVVAWLRDHR